jgi:hypothetical protein
MHPKTKHSPVAGLVPGLLAGPPCSFIRIAKCAAMSRLLKSVIALSMLSAWAALSRCTFDPSPDTHLQREVEHLQKLTIPPDSLLIDQHPPTIQGWVARADWEFQTHYSADAYSGWVAEKLRHDFHAYGSPSSPTRFSKYDQGDVEMLSVVTVPFAGMLQVTVKLEIYPD